MTEVYEQPTEYIVSALPLNHEEAHTWAVMVQWRGGDRWAVKRHSYALNAAGKWEYEPSPSNRDDEFLERCRFDLETALRLAREAAPKVVVCGMTVADVLARDEEGA